MTSKQRQEAIAAALQYMLVRGEAPYWGSAPFNNEQLVDVYIDRLGAVYFHLVSRDKFIASCSQKKVITCRKDTGYKSIFKDAAQEADWKFREIPQLNFPVGRSLTLAAWFGDSIPAQVEQTVVTTRSPNIFWQEAVDLASAPITLQRTGDLRRTERQVVRRRTSNVARILEDIPF